MKERDREGGREGERERGREREREGGREGERERGRERERERERVKERETEREEGRESDGDNANCRNEAIVDPGPETESEDPARTDPEMGTGEAPKGRPRRPAKPTTTPSEYVYF